MSNIICCLRVAESISRINTYIVSYYSEQFIFYFVYFFLIFVFYRYSADRSIHINISKFTTLITLLKNYTALHYKDYIAYST